MTPRGLAPPAATPKLDDMSAITPSAGRPVRRFVLHYAEMLLAMLIGMAVFFLPVEALFGALGAGDGALVTLLAMGLSMTAPMVAWMRFRGHSRRAALEMGAAMALPTAGVIALLATGVLEDLDALMAVEHAVMLPAMLVAMLLRKDDYLCR
jgi:flagellar biosynthetic protein FliP